MTADLTRSATILRIIGLAIIALAGIVTVDLYRSVPEYTAVRSAWIYAANFTGLATSGFLVLAAVDRIRSGDRQVPRALFLAVAVAAIAIQVGAMTVNRQLYRDHEWMTALRIMSSLGQPLLLAALAVPNDRLQLRGPGVQLAIAVVIAACVLAAKQVASVPIVPVHLLITTALQPIATATVLALVVLRPSLSQATDYDRHLSLLFVGLFLVRLVDGIWLSFQSNIGTLWLQFQTTVLTFLVMLVGLVLTRRIHAALVVPVALIGAIAAAVAALGLQHSFSDARKVDVFLLMSLGSFGLAALAVALNLAIESEDDEWSELEEEPDQPQSYESLAPTS